MDGALIAFLLPVLVGVTLAGAVGEVIRRL